MLASGELENVLLYSRGGRGEVEKKKKRRRKMVRLEAHEAKGQR